MTLINVDRFNFLDIDRIDYYIMPNTPKSKWLIKEAKANNMLIDLTGGGDRGQRHTYDKPRKKLPPAIILVMTTGHVVVMSKTFRQLQRDIRRKGVFK